MDDFLEAKTVELHLRHQRYDEIAAILHTSKTRVSRSRCDEGICYGKPVYAIWTAAEDEQLLHNNVTRGPK
jgi:hypothetical protein